MNENKATTKQFDLEFYRALKTAAMTTTTRLPV